MATVFNIRPQSRNIFISNWYGNLKDYVVEKILKLQGITRLGPEEQLYAESLKKNIEGIIEDFHDTIYDLARIKNRLIDIMEGKEEGEIDLITQIHLNSVVKSIDETVIDLLHEGLRKKRHWKEHKTLWWV